MAVKKHRNVKKDFKSFLGLLFGFFKWLFVFAVIIGGSFVGYFFYDRGYFPTPSELRNFVFFKDGQLDLNALGRGSAQGNVSYDGVESSVQRSAVSSHVLEMLFKHANSVKRSGNKICFNFMGVLPSYRENGTLLCFNNYFYINEDTREVTTDSLLMLLTKNPDIISYDTISFSSKNSEYSVNIADWEKERRGRLVSLNGDQLAAVGGADLYSKTFGSDLYFLNRAYQVMFEVNGVVSFMKNGKIMVPFVLDSRTNDSVILPYLLYKEMKENLMDKDGKIFLFNAVEKKDQDNLKK